MVERPNRHRNNFLICAEFGQNSSRPIYQTSVCRWENQECSQCAIQQGTTLTPTVKSPQKNEVTTIQSVTVFFNRFKTSEQNKYTDRLSDGFFYFYFLFLTASFHYFLPTVFSSGSLICKQTVKRVWQLRVQTAERENPPSSSSSPAWEQNSCLF